MNLKEYQLQAKRTCPSLGSEKLDLAHMVLGIFSEYEEWFNATDTVNETEELADMYWYLANYCTFRGYDISEINWEYCYNWMSFETNVSILQDYIKKYIAYNKEINKNDELYIIGALLLNINDMYGDFDIEQSLQNNIDKLRIRFPEKFDENLAKNRDLESERKELEK